MGIVNLRKSTKFFRLAGRQRSRRLTKELCAETALGSARIFVSCFYVVTNQSCAMGEQEAVAPHELCCGNGIPHQSVDGQKSGALIANHFTNAAFTAVGLSCA